MVKMSRNREGRKEIEDGKSEGGRQRRGNKIRSTVAVTLPCQLLGIIIPLFVFLQVVSLSSTSFYQLKKPSFL